MKPNLSRSHEHRRGHLLCGQVFLQCTAVKDGHFITNIPLWNIYPGEKSFPTDYCLQISCGRTRRAVSLFLPPFFSFAPLRGAYRVGGGRFRPPSSHRTVRTGPYTTPHVILMHRSTPNQRFMAPSFQILLRIDQLFSRRDFVRPRSAPVIPFPSL